MGAFLFLFCHTGEPCPLGSTLRVFFGIFWDEGGGAVFSDPSACCIEDSGSFLEGYPIAVRCLRFLGAKVWRSLALERKALWRWVAVCPALLLSLGGAWDTDRTGRCHASWTDRRGHGRAHNLVLRLDLAIFVSLISHSHSHPHLLSPSHSFGHRLEERV